jgi:polysaccharide deacetylase 2 family uncharacterized protein YibQ
MLKKPPLKKSKKTLKKSKISKIFSPTILISFIAVISAVVSGFLYIQNQQLQQIVEKQIKQLEFVKEQQLQKKKKEQELIEHAYEEKTKALDIEYADEPAQQHTFIEKPKKENVIFASKDNDNKSLPLLDNRPRLAIIIDDVTTKKQVKKIKDIGYSVNISFLPPNDRRPSSAKVAKNIEQYMIHLPLQAANNKFDEKDTLHINDSLEVIENRIIELKRLFPNAKYVNNHTGSKFTANKEAMDKLFYVLKKHNLIFIDSRTTAKSVAKEYAKKYGLQLYSRNIFLDNKKDKAYIQNQMKKAVKSAYKHGLSIAIGHPYNETLQTLKESKELLKDVNVIYVKNL